MRIDGRGEDYGVLHFQVPSRASVSAFLAEYSSLENATIEGLIWVGALYVNDKRCFVSTRTLEAGDRVRLHTTPRRYQKVPLRSRIVYENEALLVVNKPAGLPVHALTDNARENLIAFLEDDLQQNLFITHRLDIPTMGLLILAKTVEAQKSINDAIAKRKVRRTYRAFVRDAVACKEYVHWMQPSFKAPKSISSQQESSSAKCVLRVRSCDASTTSELENLLDIRIFTKSVYQLQIELGTGRAQQIRAQLSYLGAPILGDVIYGGQVIESQPNVIALQACALSLPNEEGGTIDIEI